MTDTRTPKIAIVGSGPSGCYLAQALLRSIPECEIAMLDRLVSPYGLVRYGIAADHQHTKAISRQFDRLFAHPGVRFVGNVEVGRDVSLDELRACFDAVVLATGLTRDRGLGIPGSDLDGVHGAGAIIRALNAHPDAPERLPELGSDVVVVGAGNVALDVLRFLVKGPDDYDGSDVSDTALDSYLAAPAHRVTLVSRSALPASKGDPQMLRELAQLPRATYRCVDSAEPEPGVDCELDRTAAARVDAVAALTAADRPSAPGPDVSLRFGWTPVRILGSGAVEGVELARGDAVAVVPATAVVSAIGFDPAADALSSLIAALGPDSASGRIETGLYRTGWAQRGPRGAIPENRGYARLVSDEIASDLADGSLPVVADRSGFTGLPPEVLARAIDFEQWLVLEAHERKIATPARARRKHPDHSRMASIARGAAHTDR